MMDNHLTALEVDSYLEKRGDEHDRAQVDAHLAACALCRGRVARERRVESALREMPRAGAPRDLSARITAAAELRVAAEQDRRKRLPLIAVATIFSVLLSVWFALEMVLAFQENGVLDFFALVTNQPEIFAGYSTDAVFALVESVPISEIAMTVFALLTVVVLAQQWADAALPNRSVSRNGR